MNKGVEILLERMKSNPDEFVSEPNYGANKWAGIINTYSQYLTEEENKVINESYLETVKTVMRERFTSRVMEELLDPKESESSIVSGGMTQGSYPNTYYAGVGGGGGGAYASGTGGAGGGGMGIGASVGGLTLTTNGNTGSPMWVSGQQAASSVLDAQTQSYQMQIQLEHQRELMKMQAREAQKAKKISMLERLIGK